MSLEDLPRLARGPRGGVSVVFVSTGRISAKSKCKKFLNRCWYLPSNDSIAIYVTLRDIDLSFKVNTQNEHQVDHSSTGIARAVELLFLDLLCHF